MQLGFNNNVIYRGETYHIQTEDGGISNPVITTLLFKGGVVIASKKTDYSDIIKFEGLDRVVREIMREQHAKVLKELKEGRYDSKIGIDSRQRMEGEDKTAQTTHLKRLEDAVEESMDDIILEYLATEEEG